MKIRVSTLSLIRVKVAFPKGLSSVPYILDEVKNQDKILTKRRRVPDPKITCSNTKRQVPDTKITLRHFDQKHLGVFIRKNPS